MHEITLKLVYFLKNGSCCYLKSPYFFKLMAKHIVTEWKSWGSIGSKKFKHIVSINNDFFRSKQRLLKKDQNEIKL